MDKTMNLIDRYLYQVGRDLPTNKNKRADIQAELRSLIVDALDSRFPGQEHTPEQAAAVLEDFGPPEKVAAQYYPEGQYLIGPRLYPQFRMTLGIVATVFLVVQVVLFGVAVVIRPETLQFGDLLGGVFSGLMTAFGIVVAIFWLLQRYEVQPKLDEERDWDPAELPQLPADEPVSRGEQGLGIAFALVFIGLLAFMPQWLVEFFGPDTGLALNPVFAPFVPWIIGLLLLGILLDGLLLWRGRWEPWTRVFKIVNNLLGLVLLQAMLSAHVDWLAARGLSGFMAFPEIPSGGSLPQEVAQAMAVQGTRMALLIAAVVIVIETGMQAYKLVRAYLNRAEIQRLELEFPTRQS